MRFFCCTNKKKRENSIQIPYLQNNTPMKNDNDPQVPMTYSQEFHRSITSTKKTNLTSNLEASNIDVSKEKVEFPLKELIHHFGTQ